LPAGTSLLDQRATDVLARALAGLGTQQIAQVLRRGCHRGVLGQTHVLGIRPWPETGEAEDSVALLEARHSSPDPVHHAAQLNAQDAEAPPRS
jgi:hypothetical protein